jgi:hypothetical protein
LELRKPRIAIKARSHKEESLVAYCVNSTGGNPVDLTMGFADSQIEANFLPTIPMKLMAANGFNQQADGETKLFLVETNKSGQKYLRHYSMGRYSALAAVNVVNNKGPYRELLPQMNSLIGKFADDNRAYSSADYSWGASFAGADLTESEITFARMGNSLIVIETDEKVIVKLTDGEYHYLDGGFSASDFIEWDVFPTDRIRRAAFLVCGNPILPFPPDATTSEELRNFCGDIERWWEKLGPKRTIKWVMNEQTTKTDYAVIYLSFIDKQ